MKLLPYTEKIESETPLVGTSVPRRPSASLYVYYIILLSTLFRSKDTFKRSHTPIHPFIFSRSLLPCLGRVCLASLVEASSTSRKFPNSLQNRLP